MFDHSFNSFLLVHWGSKEQKAIQALIFEAWFIIRVRKSDCSTERQKRLSVKLSRERRSRNLDLRARARKKDAWLTTTTAKHAIIWAWDESGCGMNANGCMRHWQRKEHAYSANDTPDRPPARLDFCSLLFFTPGRGSWGARKTIHSNHTNTHVLSFLGFLRSPPSHTGRSRGSIRLLH